MPITKKDLDSCPICKVFVQLTEEAACTLLKKVNPKLDINACKQVLRLKFDGKSNEEIARKLNVPVDVLLQAIGDSVKMAQKAVDEAKKGGRWL